MTKKCINNDDRCNGDDDCGDDSDEQNCTVCQAGSWQCDNRKCIKSRHKCDGDDDCGDESDERYCETCKSTSWLCNTGLRCINHNKKCDGYKDCPDNSDENCTVCNAGVDRCEDGTCLSRNLRCNGVKDCLDNSDEVNCADNTNHIQYFLGAAGLLLLLVIIVTLGILCRNRRKGTGYKYAAIRTDPMVYAEPVYEEIDYNQETVPKESVNEAGIQNESHIHRGRTHFRDSQTFVKVTCFESRRSENGSSKQFQPDSYIQLHMNNKL
uniref:Vitellogenin receptor n=1 Tax=Biomphalaria glabrata TaxID=6526 RepID=A0A2C9KT23_BIOGL